MGCSALTTVAALCLAGHLSVGLGLAQGHRDAHWSPSAVVSTPSSDSDGRHRPSQPGATDGGDTTLLAGVATTSASPGIVSAPEHLIFRSDGQGGAFTTPPEDSATTFIENSFTIPPEDIVTIYPKDSFTTSPDDITIPPEDSVRTTQESIPLTTQGTIATTYRSGGPLEMTPALEDGRVPTRVFQLVICACPLSTPDGCRRLLSDLYIDGKDDNFLDVKVRRHFCLYIVR